jgi:hypothetical protein
MNSPQKLETLAEWSDLFPMEGYKVEPGSARSACRYIDLGLDQMEDYAPT